MTVQALTAFTDEWAKHLVAVGSYGDTLLPVLAVAKKPEHAEFILRAARLEMGFGSIEQIWNSVRVKARITFMDRRREKR